MVAVLSSVFGFLAPFIPEVLNLFKRKQDIEAEERLMRLQAALAEKNAEEKLKVIEAQSQAQVSAAMLKGAHKVRKPAAVELLEAGSRYPTWLLAPVFYLFALVDVFISSVRPLVTLGLAYYYAQMKAEMVSAAVKANGAQGFLNAWTEMDAAILMVVIGYWFGQRVIQRAKQK